MIGRRTTVQGHKGRVMATTRATKMTTTSTARTATSSTMTTNRPAATKRQKKHNNQPKTRRAVECVFDQICSFGIYVIRYVMFLCFQVHFRTKQTKCFFAHAMLNIICFYVYLEEPVRVASPTRINLEEPGQGGQPT